VQSNSHFTVQSVFGSHVPCKFYCTIFFRNVGILVQCRVITQKTTISVVKFSPLPNEYKCGVHIWRHLTSVRAGHVKCCVVWTYFISVAT
jgi:hypothetical protein